MTATPKSSPTNTNPGSGSGPGPALADARRQYQGLRRGVVAALVLACAGPLSLNLVDPDLWGHVRYGQDWIADGVLHRTATHTYTAVGHPWINHENLAELALAHGHRTLGVRGLLVAKCLLGMVILGLMWLVARRQGVRPIAAWALFLLVAHNLHAFFPLRPQLLSFFWCAVMLFCIDRAFAGWGNRRNDFRHTRRNDDSDAIAWRWLVLLPGLTAVWANSHGGFVAGLAILVVLLVGRAVTLLWKQGSEARRPALGLAIITAASVATTLLNPYGWALHAWLLESLGTPRPEITEWGPPRPGNPVFWPLVGLAAIAVAALVFTKRKRDPVQLLLLVLVGWQAATHLRHVAFFAILCGFWLPPHLQSIAGQLRTSAARGLPTASLGVVGRRVALGTLAIVVTLQAVSLGGRLATLPVPRERYPVDALQWMAEQRVRGDLVVCFNWAQYAIAALAPDVRVSFDGRFRTCYPQAVIDRHFDFLIGENWPRHRRDGAGPIDGLATLDADRPDYVLVDRSYPNAVASMDRAASAPDSPWRLLYQDGVAAVWGHADVVDPDHGIRPIPLARRLVSEHRSPTAVEWPALPRDRPPFDLPERHSDSPVAQATAGAKDPPTLDRG